GTRRPRLASQRDMTVISGCWATAICSAKRRTGAVVVRSGARAHISSACRWCGIMPSAKRTSAAAGVIGPWPSRSPGVAVRAVSPGPPGTITGASVPMGEGWRGSSPQATRAEVSRTVTNRARIPDQSGIASILSYDTRGTGVTFAKVRWAALGAAFLLVTACAGSPEAEAPATSQETSVSSGVMTSDNVTHVANVPPTAPLDGEMDWNTDMAFQGDYLFMGNFGGFTIYDIGDPTAPKIVSQVACPAQQNDVSIYENLLILSIDAPRSGPECDSTEDRGAWEGLRIFDVSDKTEPKYVGAVATDCGSHTHTMVPKDGKLFVYVSSPGPEPESETCPPPHQLL